MSTQTARSQARTDKKDPAPSSGLSDKDIKNIHSEITTSYPDAIASDAIGGKFQATPHVLRNLTNILRLACLLSPDKGVLHIDEHGNERMQTNKALMESAKQVVSGLRSKGFKPGDQVVLLIDDQPLYLSAFWGAILGGFIPVPLPIPGIDVIDDDNQRLTKVFHVLKRFCVITDQPLADYASLDTGSVFHISELMTYPQAKKIHKAKFLDTAIILFSSGSTGDPKGVSLSHKNILCMLEAGSQAFGDVPQGDGRTSIGFAFYVLRKTLFGEQKQGRTGKIADWIAASSIGRMVARTGLGKYIIDTLQIFSGNIISANLRMNWNDIVLANWMPNFHVTGLLGYHVGPTGMGYDQIAIKPKVFSENPALLLKLVDRYRITHFPCPNFAAEWLSSQVRDQDIEGIDLSCIKMLGNGSEPISADTTRAFINKFKAFGMDPKAMCFGYGMSEATGMVSITRMSEDIHIYKVDRKAFFEENLIILSESDTDVMEIPESGLPIQQITIRIVDDQNNILRENMVGHVQVKGPYLFSAGYFNKPEATEACYADDWYKTGDMGFMIKGRLVVTGRQKDIILINGHNIYAHDIENQIMKIPGMEGVDFAVTGIMQQDSDAERSVLFINSKESKKILASRLLFINRALLKSIGIKLDYIYPVDEIPRTPTGSKQRFKLRKQYANCDLSEIIAPESQSEENYKAPENPLQKRLIDIWQDVLGIARIGTRDSFFEMGGNSLKAISLISIIHKELNIELPLEEIFNRPSVLELSEYMTQLPENTYTPIKISEKKPYYPLSSAQNRFFFLQQLDPDNLVFNVSVILEVDGKVEKAAMEAIVEKMVQRHESFRTTFHWIDNKPAQIIHDKINVHIEYRHADSEAIADEIKNFIKPFNLETGPLFRIGLIEVEEDRHILILDTHHIISDGTSAGVMVRDFLSLYSQQELPDIQVNYKDYAEWQNSPEYIEQVKSQKTFWLNEFSDGVPLLHLPADYPRPEFKSFQGRTLYFSINQEDTSLLNELALKENTTLFMVLLAAFNIFLSKITGQEDIVIGTSLAGRRNQELQKLVGLFLNTLPLRNRPESHKTFKTFLEEVRTKTIGVFKNQDYQYETLVKDMQIESDTSRNAMFDVHFMLQNMDIPEIEIHDMTIKPWKYDNPISQLDLSFFITEANGKLDIAIEYCTKLFQETTIQNFFKIYSTVITSIIQQPDICIQDIEIIPEEEKQHILNGFNQPVRKSDDHATIVHLFEQQVAATPDKPAIITGHEKITYRELNDKSNLLAGQIIKENPAENSIIAILLDNPADYIAAIFGVLKAGHAYLPLDSNNPVKRIEHILQDSNASAMISQYELIEGILFKGKLIEINAPGSVTKGLENPEIPCSPDMLAYIIYTSGSTGKPKGVMVSHKNLTTYVNAFLKEFDPTSGDIILQQASFAFDASIEEIFPILTRGGAIAAPDKNKIKDPEVLSDFIHTHNVSMISCSPMLLNAFNSLDDLTRLDHVHTFISGGDVLRQEHFNNLKHMANIYNTYGPTETTVCATYYKYDDQAEGLSAGIPIGKPISNYRVLILDRHLKMMPTGVPGEICISGPGVTRGYINQKELTEDRFLSDPYDPEYALYRTGDQGKYLNDGNIVFIGRVDEQVQVHGYRIELGEVKRQLMKHGKVEDAAVIARMDEHKENYLCAYVVSNSDITVTELRDFLSGELPSYMIPLYFIPLAKLPYTHSGKLEKKYLPDPGSVSPNLDNQFVPPTTKTEQVLADIIGRILNIDQVGIDDNFFDLGGDSLKAINVIAAIHKELNTKIELADFFNAPDVKNLADLISDKSEQHFLDIPKVRKNDHYELSYNQKRLWILNQLEPDSSSYNLQVLTPLHQEIDDKLLLACMQEIMKRHESLRTGFKLVDHEPRQYIVPEVDIPFKNIDLSDQPENKKEDLASQIYIEEILTPFDLNTLPLFRVVLIKLAPARHWLIINMHHIISDGWSIDILRKELIYFYEAKRQGINSDLEPLNLQYKDFAAWQQKQILDNHIREKSLEFWKNKLKTPLPALNLPYDYSSGTQDHTSACYRCVVPDSVKTKLKQLAGENHTSLFIMLLSVFNLFLSKVSGQKEIVCGIPGAGREHSSLQNIVGFFINTLMVKSVVEKNEPFTQFLDQVNKDVINILQYQSYPLELVFDELKMRYPEIPVFFNMFNMQDLSVRAEMTQKEAFHLDRVQDVKFNLLIYCIEYKDGIELQSHYRTSKFKKQTIEYLLGEYLALLEYISAHPDKSLGDFQNSRKRRRFAKNA